MITRANLNGRAFNYVQTPLGAILEHFEGITKLDFYSKIRGDHLTVVSKTTSYLQDKHQYSITYALNPTGEKAMPLTERIEEPTKEVLRITPQNQNRHIIVTRDTRLDRTLVSVISPEGKTISRKAFFGINGREDVVDLERYVRSLY